MTGVHVIKRFSGRLGEITLERWEEDGTIQYKVNHSNSIIGAHEWFKDYQRGQAVAYYQFLCAKY